MRFYRFTDPYDMGKLIPQTFELIKETKCGYWIGYEWDKKWVSKTARKRFAYPTIEEAKESYLQRKYRQVAILEVKLKKAKTCLEMAKGKIETYYDLDFFL